MSDSAIAPNTFTPAPTRFPYPSIAKDDVVDNYHGTPVADPYRSLEDENAPTTRRWIEEQNRLTFGYLRSLPMRERLRSRLEELWNFERYFPPFKRGGAYFMMKNDGLQNHAVLYRQESLDASPEIVLDPNTFSKDGTVSLASLNVSPDGSMIAYGTSDAGSDWQTIRVRETTSGRELDDTVERAKFTAIEWTHDGKGFFYSRFPEPDAKAEFSQTNLHHAVYYHRLGRPQREDVQILATPEHPRRFFFGSVSDDGRYLIVAFTETSGPVNGVACLDLVDPASPRLDGGVRILFDENDSAKNFLGNDGTRFYFYTDADAPRGRIIAFDLSDPDEERWETIVPEGEDVIQEASLVGDRFLVTYMHDAYSVVRFFAIDGTPAGELSTPTLGSIYGMSGRRQDEEIFYMFTSFLYPSTIFRYEIASGTNEVFHAPTLDFDPAAYETSQIWSTSADGVRVPMFVTHKKGIALDGSNPTILTGYGGFNVSLTPSFTVPIAVWIEQGGIYVVANLRGGGEFGGEWYRAGTLDRKQNVFNDLIASAERLFELGYSSPGKLAIKGGSNGGLLVGAVMTQRPDLAAVALPSVGVMDMLRYHRFTIGEAWKGDYGTSDDPKMFPVLYGYSPYHQLSPATRYPATLVTTGDHDDRVVPAHSFKFAARLQECQEGERPVMIRVETRAGHGAGKPLALIIEEQADVFAFALHNLGADEA